MTIGKPLPEGEDDSYVPKFKTGELVAFYGLDTYTKYIGEVMPKSQFNPYTNAMMYYVKCEGATFHVSEYRLRYLTFGEFALHRNTRGNGFMVGKTRGWMALLIHVFTLIVFASGFTVEGPWKIAPFVIGAGVISIFWYGTWANFTKRLV